MENQETKKEQKYCKIVYMVYVNDEKINGVMEFECGYYTIEVGNYIAEYLNKNNNNVHSFYVTKEVKVNNGENN